MVVLVLVWSFVSVVELMMCLCLPLRQRFMRIMIKSRTVNFSFLQEDFGDSDSESTTLFMSDDEFEKHQRDKKLKARKNKKGIDWESLAKKKGKQKFTEEEKE